MPSHDSIKELAKEFGLTLPPDNFEKARHLLAEQVKYWLIHHFDKLISILYRMDVSEEKLKGLIQQNPEADAGLIIADLMIERQAAKIKSRQQWRQRDNDINEEEKW